MKIRSLPLVWRFSAFAVPLFAFLQSVATADALTITRTTTDIVDLVPGADLWSASYTLSGALPSTDEGFTVYFDAALYANLTGSFAAASADWDMLLVQPDTGLGAPGFLDGLSLSALPAYTGPFTVNFTWLGSGAPGTQDFEVYSLANGFEILSSGQVSTPNSSAVPEGSSLGITGLAVCAWLFLLRLRKSAGRVLAAS